jgi:hypothetical protein
MTVTISAKRNLRLNLELELGKAELIKCSWSEEKSNVFLIHYSLHTGLQDNYLF